ncbi:MAG TPA: cytochrome P450, partial [Candidatus Dormibacteraeota bacterium]
GLLNDLRLGRDIDRPNRSYAFRFRPVQAQTAGLFRSTLLVKNPPAHTRLRGLVSQAFTWRRLKTVEPRIAELARQRLDVIAEKGEADVMADLAFPLPVAVIGELVGVPEGEREPFRELVRRQFSSGDGAAQVTTELESYFADLVARRRAHRDDDLLSDLIDARDESGRLSEDELRAMAMIIFLAGFVTTTNLIGNGLLALLHHPDELGRLRRDPGLVQPAVQEMLRYDPPVQVVPRTVLEPAELDGRRLPPGENVVCMVAAANRDPRRFPDPDRFDVGRTDGQPLSFGWGIHHCLGSVLASLEGQIVFRQLIGRFDTIGLLEDDPPLTRGSFLRGRERLPVRVTSAWVAGSAG